MCIYFLLRFEFWVFWLINHSMAKLIKKSAVDKLWYILYPRIKLTLFISHSHIHIHIPISVSQDCEVSIEARLRTRCCAVCMLLEARNFLLSQNIWTFSRDHPEPSSIGNGAPYLVVKW